MTKKSLICYQDNFWENNQDLKYINMLKVKLLFLPHNLKTDLAAWEKSLMRKIISFNVLQ
jgi:hypothetical protein